MRVMDLNEALTIQCLQFSSFTIKTVIVEHNSD